MSNGLGLFLLGFFLGVLSFYFITDLNLKASHEDNYWLRAIHTRLEYIEKKITKIEENLDEMNRNFQKVRDYNKIRVKISN